LGFPLCEPIHRRAVQEMEYASTASAHDAVMHEVRILIGRHPNKLALRGQHITRQIFADVAIEGAVPVVGFLGTVVDEAWQLRAVLNTVIWAVDDIARDPFHMLDVILSRSY